MKIKAKYTDPYLLATCLSKVLMMNSCMVSQMCTLFLNVIQESVTNLSFYLSPSYLANLIMYS